MGGSLAPRALAAEACVSDPRVDVRTGLARLHVAKAALVGHVAHRGPVAGLGPVGPGTALPGLEAVDPARESGDRTRQGTLTGGALHYPYTGSRRFGTTEHQRLSNQQGHRSMLCP